MLFYIRRQKNYKAGAMPIYMRISVDGKRADMSKQNWTIATEAQIGVSAASTFFLRQAANDDSVSINTRPYRCL